MSPCANLYTSFCTSFSMRAGTSHTIPCKSIRTNPCTDACRCPCTNPRRSIQAGLMFSIIFKRSR